MPSRRYRGLLGGILAGLPNLIAAGFVIGYLADHDLAAPKSFAVVIGQWSVAWTWTVIFTLIGSGLLSLGQRWMAAMQVEKIVRPAASFMLAGYAVALGSSESPAWITVGFVAASAVEQWRRWWTLTNVNIPEAQALAVLREEADENGGH